VLYQIINNLWWSHDDAPIVCDAVVTVASAPTGSVTSNPDCLRFDLAVGSFGKFLCKFVSAFPEMVESFHLVPFGDFWTGVDGWRRWFTKEGKGFSWFELVGWFLRLALGLLCCFCANPIFFFFEKFFNPSFRQTARSTNNHSFFGMYLDTEGFAC